MKKQVNPVLVPQNKQGYSKGDICQRLNESTVFPEEKKGYLHIAVKDYSSPNPDWQAQQVLILDESAEIKEGDNYLDDVNNIRQAWTSDNNYWRSREEYNKIIASHPCIQGTLPISKSFLEMWVKRPDAKVYVECDRKRGRWLLETEPSGNIVLTLENEEVKEEVDTTKPICYWGNWGVDEFIEKVDRGYRLYSTVDGEKNAETFIDEPTARALYETLGKLLNHSKKSK